MSFARPHSSRSPLWLVALLCLGCLPPHDALAHGLGGRANDPYAVPLGPLPKGFFVNRPQRPAILRTVDVRNPAEFDRCASRNGSRLRVHVNIPRPVTVRASDMEILVDPGVQIAKLMVAKGQRRVRIHGGNYGSIMLQLPNGGTMGKGFGQNDFVQDVMVDDVTIDNEDSNNPAFGMYGRRVAIVDSRIRSTTYAIWGRGIEPGPGMPTQPVQDLIVARCVLESNGRSPRGDGHIEGAKNEATVRLVYMERSAIVDSYLLNSVDGFVPVPAGGNTKANYRIHGKSDQNLFARNVLVNSGTQFAADDDDLGAFYFIGNTFYHSSPDLFNPKAGHVRYVEARDNVVYTSSQQRCLGCRCKQPAWRVEHNEVRPFKSPPPPPERWAGPQGDDQRGAKVSGAKE
jgi:hypothetical protein